MIRVVAYLLAVDIAGFVVGLIVVAVPRNEARS